VKTAMPEESGPRSVMPISIGTMNSPSRGLRDFSFSSKPTIPHIKTPGTSTLVLLLKAACGPFNREPKT
jgi:hypothetical protein